MPGTPNRLIEMGNLENVVVLKGERPIVSFEKTVQSRGAVRIFDGNPIPEHVMRECL